MRKKVLAEQLAHLLQELESNSDDAFPRDWSLIDIVGSVAQRRDWFKVVCVYFLDPVEGSRSSWI